MIKYENLDKIISGGQTGADVAGLRFAHHGNIPTGGTAPKGYQTENGNMPTLLRDVYGLGEQGNYRQRTILNIKNSCGTVIFCDKTSPGSVLTMNQCKKLQKPYIINPTPDNFVEWLQKHRIAILNVAGNRESKSPGIEKRIIKFLALTIYTPINL